MTYSEVSDIQKMALRLRPEERKPIRQRLKCPLDCKVTTWKMGDEDVPGLKLYCRWYGLEKEAARLGIPMIEIRSGP